MGFFGDSFLLTLSFESPTCNLIHGVAVLAAAIMGIVFHELYTCSGGHLLASKIYHASAKVFDSINCHSLNLI